MPNQSTTAGVLDCLIIGAGISGIAAACNMRSRGMTVAILEKGRGVGGRMATRRMNGAILDHGAQFFTSREGYFANELTGLIDMEAAISWHDNGYGVMRYRGIPGMTGIAKHLAQEVDIRKQHLVTHVSWERDHWMVQCDNGSELAARTVLSTAPMPQAIALINSSQLNVDPSQLEDLVRISYKPTIALLAVLKSSSTMQSPGILQFDEHPVLSTITDNQVKGISDVPAITLHSSHVFAEEHLETMTDATAEAMLSAASEYIQFEVDEWKLHRWRYAQCVNRHPDNYARLKDYPLWFAGDGFGNSRLEQAADSGIEAAESILNYCS